MASIVFDRVDKFFGPHQVLHRLSFQVQPGEIVGLLGPNGSGKTTTLRLIAGYYQADAGRVKVQGMAGRQIDGRHRNYVGYLPEKAPLYDSLTVSQYLQFVGRCKGLRGHRLSASLDTAMAAFNLEEVRNTAIARLSKGFRQRAGLAQAILGDPSVLLLDEATNGLDPIQTIEAREMIRRASEGRAVLFSSHLMQEIQALCTRAIILRNGRLVTDVPLNVPAIGGRQNILLHWRGSAAALKQLRANVTAIDGVLEVQARCGATTEHHILTIGFAQRPPSLNPVLAYALELGQVEQFFYEGSNVEDILVNAVRQADRNIQQMQEVI